MNICTYEHLPFIRTKPHHKTTSTDCRLSSDIALVITGPLSTSNVCDLKVDINTTYAHESVHIAQDTKNCHDTECNTEKLVARSMPNNVCDINRNDKFRALCLLSLPCINILKLSTFTIFYIFCI